MSVTIKFDQIASPVSEHYTPGQIVVASFLNFETGAGKVVSVNDATQEVTFEEAAKEEADERIEQVTSHLISEEVFNKTVEDYQMFDEPYAEMANDRVDAEPELTPYRDLLIEYDWDNQGEHWQWVSTAPISEIVDWAKNIRASEEE